MVELKQVWEVDKDGNIIESYLYGNDEIVTAKDNGRIIIEFSWSEPFLDPLFDFNSNTWKEGKDPIDILAEAKSSKISELKKACEQAIIDGFISSNGHKYRTNRDDQTNMLGQKDKLMFDPTITTVLWKTEDSGYISHSRDEWLTIYNEAFDHKQKQLFKYDSLKKNVLDLDITNSDEINSITW